MKEFKIEDVTNEISEKIEELKKTIEIKKETLDVLQENYVQDVISAANEVFPEFSTGDFYFDYQFSLKFCNKKYDSHRNYFMVARIPVSNADWDYISIEMCIRDLDLTIDNDYGLFLKEMEINKHIFSNLDGLKEKLLDLQKTITSLYLSKRDITIVINREISQHKNELSALLDSAIANYTFENGMSLKGIVPSHSPMIPFFDKISTKNVKITHKYDENSVYSKYSLIDKNTFYCYVKEAITKSLNLYDTI